MIGDLEPHAAYKDSGQDWLGSIPAHWSLLRAKRLFREVDERSKTGKEELLSVSHLTGVTPRRLKTVTMFMAESNVGYKVCRPGDLVINTLWAWMAALGVTRHTGLVSPAYGVYRPIDGGGRGWPAESGRAPTIFWSADQPISRSADQPIDVTAISNGGPWRLTPAAEFGGTYQSYLDVIKSLISA